MPLLIRRFCINSMSCSSSDNSSNDNNTPIRAHHRQYTINSSSSSSIDNRIQPRLGPRWLMVVFGQQLLILRPAFINLTLNLNHEQMVSQFTSRMDTKERKRMPLRIYQLIPPVRMIIIVTNPTRITILITE